MEPRGFPHSDAAGVVGVNGAWCHESTILSARARTKSRSHAFSIEANEPTYAIDASLFDALESPDDVRRMLRACEASDRSLTSAIAGHSQ